MELGLDKDKASYASLNPKSEVDIREVQEAESMTTEKTETEILRTTAEMQEEMRLTKSQRFWNRVWANLLRFSLIKLPTGIYHKKWHSFVPLWAQAISFVLLSILFIFFVDSVRSLNFIRSVNQYTL